MRNHLIARPHSGQLTDSQREREIERAYRAFVGAGSATSRATAWQAMRTLIQQRSRAQIRRMEIERGLRVEGQAVAASAAAIEDAAEVA
jgi:hypothetical protein